MTVKQRARVALIAGLFVLTPWILTWIMEERDPGSFHYFIAGLPTITVFLLYLSPFVAIVLFWMAFGLSEDAPAQHTEIIVEIIGGVLALALLAIILGARLW